MHIVSYKNYRYLIICLSCFFLAALFLSLSFVSESKILPYFLTCILFFILFVPIYIAISKGKFDLFHPLVFTSLAYFFPYYVIKSLGVLFLDIRSSFSTILYDNYYLSLSILYVIVAYVSLAVGFYLKIGLKLSRKMPSLEKRKSLSIDVNRLILPIFISYLFGIFLSWWLEKAGASGPYVIHQVYLFTLITKVSKFCLFLAWFSFFQNNVSRKRWLPYIFIMTVIEIGLGLTSGSRLFLAWDALICFGAYQYSRWQTAKLREYIIGFSLIIMFLIVGFIFSTTFRSIKFTEFGRFGACNLRDRVYTFKSTVDSISRLSLSEKVEFLKNTIFNRMSSLDTLGLILAHYKDLKTMEKAFGINDNLFPHIFWSFVPRFVYPNKPILMDFSRYFGYIYNETPLEGYSYAAVTAIGDLYRNGGIGAVIIGMLVLGIMLRVLYAWLMERDRSPTAANALLFLFIVMGLRITYEGCYASFLAVSIRHMVIIFAFLFLLSRFGRKRMLKG